MAGFVTMRYETDRTNTFLCRVEKITPVLTIYGDGGAGEIDEFMIIESSASRRSTGIHPRGVILSRLLGTEPAENNVFGYVPGGKSYRFVPIGTKALFNTGTHASLGEEVTIKGAVWTIGSRVSEVVK